MPLTHRVRTRLGWDRLVYPEDVLREALEVVAESARAAVKLHAHTLIPVAAAAPALVNA